MFFLFFFQFSESGILAKIPSNIPSLVSQMVNNLLAMQETRVWSLGLEDLLEKGMATHSSILPGEFHGQRSLVGYSPWGSQRVEYNWATNTFTFSLDAVKPAQYSTVSQGI